MSIYCISMHFLPIHRKPSPKLPQLLISTIQLCFCLCCQLHCGNLGWSPIMLHPLTHQAAQLLAVDMVSWMWTVSLSIQNQTITTMRGKKSTKNKSYPMNSMIPPISHGFPEMFPNLSLGKNKSSQEISKNDATPHPMAHPPILPIWVCLKIWYLNTKWTNIIFPVQ